MQIRHFAIGSALTIALAGLFYFEFAYRKRESATHAALMKRFLYLQNEIKGYSAGGKNGPNPQTIRDKDLNPLLSLKAELAKAKQNASVRESADFAALELQTDKMILQCKIALLIDSSQPKILQDLKAVQKGKLAPTAASNTILNLLRETQNAINTSGLPGASRFRPAWQEDMQKAVVALEIAGVGKSLNLGLVRYFKILGPLTNPNEAKAKAALQYVRGDFQNEFMAAENRYGQIKPFIKDLNPKLQGPLDGMLLRFRMGRFVLDEYAQQVLIQLAYFQMLTRLQDRKISLKMAEDLRQSVREKIKAAAPIADRVPASVSTSAKNKFNKFFSAELSLVDRLDVQKLAKGEGQMREKSRQEWSEISGSALGKSIDSIMKDFGAVLPALAK